MGVVAGSGLEGYKLIGVGADAVVAAAAAAELGWAIHRLPLDPSSFVEAGSSGWHPLEEGAVEREVVAAAAAAVGDPIE